MKRIRIILCLPLTLMLMQSCGTLNQKQEARKKTQSSATQQPKERNRTLTSLENNQNLKLEYISKDEAQSLDQLYQIRGSSVVDPKLSPADSVYFLYGAEHLKLKNYYFDFPVVYNSAVQKWVSYFLNHGKEFFIRYSERAGRYAPILSNILEIYGLPRDLIFLAMAESGFQNKAKSSAKAVGPWQFMPNTAKNYGLKINNFVDERRDPIKSTIAASKYLKKLYEYFGSWELAAAGYNAGEGKINRAIKKYNTQNFWDIRKGRYLKNETKNYVPKIMGLAIIGKNLETFGMKDIDFHEPLDFEEISVAGNTDLIVLSDKMGLDVEEIHRLNPELLRWMTPPQDVSYNLRVPVGIKQVWNDCCQESDFIAKSYQTYQLPVAQTLNQVASHFNLKVQILSELNQIKPYKLLPKESVIVLPFRENHNRYDQMYTDLYQRNKKSSSNKKSRRMLAPDELTATGYKLADQQGVYKVKKGDTLWTISRKVGIPVDKLLKSNNNVANNGRIREGDVLIIR